MPRKPRALKGYIPAVGETVCFRQVRELVDALTVGVDYEVKQAQITYKPTGAKVAVDKITRWVPFARLVRKAGNDAKT